MSTITEELNKLEAKRDAVKELLKRINLAPRNNITEQQARDNWLNNYENFALYFDYTKEELKTTLNSLDDEIVEKGKQFTTQQQLQLNNSSNLTAIQSK